MSKGYKVEFPDPGKVSQALVREVMPDLVEIVAERARENAPRRSGKLRASIETRVELFGLRGVVAATARHAHLVHEGTKSHPMRASGRAMVIYTGGEVQLRRSANHPGTRAQPFLRDALEASAGEITSVLQGNERALSEAIKP